MLSTVLFSNLPFAATSEAMIALPHSGGSIGIGFFGDRAPGDNNRTLVYIEPGFQMRAFIASNVALSFTGGLTLGTADAEGVAVTAQPTALAGAHYYFF